MVIDRKEAEKLDDKGLKLVGELEQTIDEVLLDEFCGEESFVVKIPGDRFNSMSGEKGIFEQFNNSKLLDHLSSKYVENGWNFVKIEYMDGSKPYLDIKFE